MTSVVDDSTRIVPPAGNVSPAAAHPWRVITMAGVAVVAFAVLALMYPGYPLLLDGLPVGP